VFKKCLSLNYWIIVSILTVVLSQSTVGQTALVKEGSIIIDMGVMPQTTGNALKPYGLVYSLIANYYTPVLWSINPSKVADGVDFTIDGQDFSGGPFIVPKDYLTSDVLTEIAAWEAQGVVTYTTQSSQLLPLYRELEYFAQWALDAENGDIAVGYLNDAGIPASAYDFVDPADLSFCNDLYVMPHADPTWATHENLFDWNNSDANGGDVGWIWAGCHAVSVMESLVDPDDANRTMNFLSNGLVFKNPLDASGAANYEKNYPTDPFMQFMGITSGAHAGGSEQLYIPLLTQDWRSTTRIGALDNTLGNSAAEKDAAALIAYGYAFGDGDRGQVMYEAGHKLDNGTEQENIAAIRAFLNFSFDAPQNKAPAFVDNSFEVPVVAGQNQDISFEVDAEAFPNGLIVMQDIIWVSNTDGSIVSNLTGGGTAFVNGTATFTTPNNITEDITAIVTAVAQDDCGRVSILKWNITVLANPTAPTAVDDNYTTYEEQPVSFNILSNDTDPNEDIDASSVVLLDPITELPNPSLVTADGEFIDNGNGNITFVPAAGFTGTVTLKYQVSDATNLTSNVATITVTVEAPPITCTGDFKSIALGNPTTVNATSASGGKNPDRAVGGEDGEFAEIKEVSGNEDELTLNLTNAAGAGYAVTFYWGEVKNDSDLRIEFFDASNNVVDSFDPFNAIDDGITSVTPSAAWEYLTIYQEGDGKNAKAKLDYIEATELSVFCIDDRDGDLIADDIDLDDDNDGILDVDEGEGSCSQVEEIVNLTSTLDERYENANCGNTPFSVLVDNTSGTCDDIFYFGDGANHGSIAGETIFLFQFSQALTITELRVVKDRVDPFLENASTFRVEGSNDNMSYTDLTGTLTSTGNTATNDRIFDLSSNTTSYEYYRIYGISGNYGWSPYIQQVQFTAAACVPSNATDTDMDGVPDYWDLDSDNDGITDNIEAQSTAGYIQPSGVFDSNGVDEAYNGGLTAVDTDGDMTPDYRDTNSDDEGADDNTEARVSPNDLGVPGNIEPNGLGINYGGSSSYSDVNGPDYDNTPAGEFEDTDGDFGAGGDVDWRDAIVGADSDGDGILDDIDIDDDNDGILDVVEGDVDTDGDGIVNRLDLDSDGDGIPDNIEAQTTLGYISPGVYADVDNDGLNDIYDISEGGTTLVPVDTDGDGTVDYLDLNSDNKTGNDTTEGGIILGGVIGPNGLDTNLSDGTYNDVNGNFGDDQTANWPDDDGDVLLGGDVDWRDNIDGIDSDGDGEFDEQDIDDDNDGILDSVENNGLSDPLNDQDLDGTFDYLDSDATGFVDSNNDGVDDRYDTDLDGIIDQYDLDSDNDGIPDIVEAGGTDSDGNGIVDGTFTDTDEDGWSNVFDSDNGGTAHPDPDSDSDGLEDRIDLDSDNDGIPDVVEAQSTLGYIGITGTDADGDGIDNAFDPDSGGTLSSSPVNTDGIGDPDYLDLDSDDDGIDDIDESGSGLTDANNDGRTDGTVGNNGLDDTLEQQDDYTDPDGDINSPKDDLADEDNDVEFGGDVDYRDDTRNTPGGVDACISLWLRADKGGTSWTSFSDNNITATQSGSISSGALLNFNAANDFVGGYYDSDLSINSDLIPDATIFAVYVPDIEEAGSVWGETDGSTDRWLSNSTVTNGTGVEAEVPDVFRANSPSLTAVIFDEDAVNGSFVYVDGELEQTFTSNHGSETSNDLEIGARGGAGTRFDGRIAEVIVFCEILNASNFKKVQSYLALKYGITLNNNPIGDGDYVAVDGTTIWNSTDNASHHNNVAGIFRDDVSFLEQKQSKSSNPDAIVTIGLDIGNGLESSNVDNDGTFDFNTTALVWGHDNADIDGGPGSIAETEYDPNQVNARLNREWKVQETGETGTVTIEFDVGGLLGPDNMVGTSDESQIVLLVDEDGDFSSGAQLISQSFVVADDGKVVFQHNFTDGWSFTLASSEVGALPITLISFDGDAKDHGVELNWSTSDEVDNSHMIVERSNNGFDFERIGMVDGSGTSSAINHYLFTDKQPHEGINYYRLVDVDFHANEDYSATIMVEFKYPELIKRMYPNPVRRGDKVFIETKGDPSLFSIGLYNSSGIKEKLISEVDVRGKAILRTGNLLPGLYMVVIRNGDQTNRYKLWIR